MSQTLKADPHREFRGVWNKYHAVFWAGLLLRGPVHFWVKVLFLPGEGGRTTDNFRHNMDQCERQERVALSPYLVDPPSTRPLGTSVSKFFLKCSDNILGFGDPGSLLQPPSSAVIAQKQLQTKCKQVGIVVFQ